MQYVNNIKNTSEHVKNTWKKTASDAIFRRINYKKDIWERLFKKISRDSAMQFLN